MSKIAGGDGCRWYFECQDQVLVAWPKFAVFVFVVFQNEPPGRGGRQVGGKYTPGLLEVSGGKRS